MRNLERAIPNADSFEGWMTLVRQECFENSECGEDLTKNGRISYMSELDKECIKERYVRVTVIIITTIDGNKSNYV